MEFLRERAGDLDEPFFLGVGITKPHLNWWVPSAYFDLYDPAAIRAALRKSLQDGSIIPGNGEYFDVPPMSVPSPDHPQIAANFDLWADYIHGYLASVSYADAKVGEVLDALEADPALAADTAILLWSDHGYHLGDKDRWGKFTHWKEATQVPFIYVDPDEAGRADGAAGRQPHRHLPDRARLDGHRRAGPARPHRRQPAADRAGRRHRLVQSRDRPRHRPDDDRRLGVDPGARPGQGRLPLHPLPRRHEELYDISRDPNEHVNRVNFDTGKGKTAGRRRDAHADERPDGRPARPAGLS